MGSGYRGAPVRERGRRRVTVVYLDLVFLLNGVVDYLLLLSAGRLAGECLHRGRLALGAVLGGLYAGAVFLPGMGFLVLPPCKIGAAVLMLLCAYGGSRHLLRVSLVFFAVSAAFGGGVFALSLLGGRGIAVQNGVFYSALDLRLILLSAAVCYGVLRLAFGRGAGHSPGELRSAVVTLGERKVSLTALVDTGHTLTDPVSGQPVLVAEGERMAGLFPPGEALEGLSGTALGRRLRLLPYRAVGVECGFLLAVRSDGVRVGREDYGAILVALSPTPVSDGGGYSALIGA